MRQGLGHERMSRAAWVVLAVLAGSGTAWAQSREDLERAKLSFQAGATAYAAGDYLAAIQALESAYARTPLPAIAFSLAQAERRQYFVAHDPEHLLRAIELYRRYVDQVPAGGRRADALDALSELEPLALAVRGTNPPGHGAAAGGTEAVQGAPVAQRPTRLMITADVPGVALSLDGGPPAPSPLIREVDPGAHSVQASADGFASVSRQVTAVAGELIPASLSLPEKPSTLTVAAPDKAEVYVDGTLASRTGGRVTLQLASGPHRVTVAQKGRRVEDRALTLGRGTSADLTVNLSATRQRQVSLGLLIGGATTFVAGAVLGGLALSAQSRAQEFLDRRNAGNVSSGELADYQSAVSARNRYRVAAAIGLGTAAGLLGASLILYQLDEPDPRDLVAPRSAPPANTPAAPDAAIVSSRLRWRVAPIVSAESWGAVVGLRF
ncbi:MAG: hypothetical protein ACJ8F1_16020 [Polyangia bacterium]